MKRRDLLKSCAVPALGIAATVEGVQSLPPLILYDPKRETYAVPNQTVTKTSNVQFDAKPDTMESLAAEFGYEVVGTPYEGTNGKKQFISQFVKGDGIFAFCIKIEYCRVKMPLREQFIFADAKHKAFQAARTDI